MDQGLNHHSAKHLTCLVSARVTKQLLLKKFNIISFTPKLGLKKKERKQLMILSIEKWAT